MNNKIKSFDGVVKKTQFKKSVVFSPVQNTMIFRSIFLKIFGISIVSFSLLFLLSSVGGTVAYYKDNEDSVGNKLLAKPLSFDVQIASSTSAQVNFGQTGDVLVPFMFPLENSKEIKYYVKSEFVSGDYEFCNMISVLGTFPFPYDGKLIGLETSTSTQSGSWTLTFSAIDLNLFSNRTCTVDLVYRGTDASTDSFSGYSDTQKVTITFTSPEVVIQQQTLETIPNEVVVEQSVVENTPAEAIVETVQESETMPPVEENQ